VFAALAALALTLALAAFSGATLNPPTATFTLQPGTGTSETNKTVTLPTFPGRADVEIAIDTTGSMTGGINDAIAEANALVAGVQAEVPDTDFAVVQFRDTGDTPEYQVMQSMTPSGTKVQDALSLLVAGGGGDPPESYNLVFHNSYADASNALGWRDGTRKFVIVIGDAQPHGNVKTQGFSNCVDVSPDLNGLSTSTELAGMKAAQRTLLMIHETDPGNTTSLDCYQQLAAAAYPIGGAVDSGGSGLAQAIIALINSAFSTVKDVHLEVDSATPAPADASWITLPPALGPVSAPGTYQFGPIGINVPAGTPSGTYTFDLVAKADGVDIGHETITVNVPPENGLVVCKAADNGAAGQTFSFTATKGTGSPTALPDVTGGNCSAAVTTLAAGRYTVKENLSSGKWAVTGIAVDPQSALVAGSVNLGAGSVKVNLSATSQTKVTFTNTPISATLKVCKWSTTPSLQGKQYTFSANTAPTPTTFTATAGATKATAGCSAATAVSPGALTIKESLPAGQTVKNVVAGGVATVSNFTAAGVAKVTIGNGANIVYYRDEPAATTAYMSVCKFAATDRTKGTYYFTVDDHKGHRYDGNDIALTVDGSDVNTQQACAHSILVAIGNVDVAELNPHTLSSDLTAITGDPQSALVASDLGAGTATVKVTATNNPTVTFRNQHIDQGTGIIEICKKMTDAAYNGTTFTFKIPTATDPANRQIQVDAGSCSPQIEVAFGPTDITEVIPEGFGLFSVTATDNVSHSLLLGTSGTTATVTPGTKTNETLVTFTNRPLTVQLKVCKLIAVGSEAALGGKDFSFSVTYNNSPPFTVSVQHPYPGPNTCTTLLLNQPVINPDGTKAVVTVKEVQGAGFLVSAITVSNAFTGTNPAIVLGPGGYVTFNPGAGVDVVTFTNAAATGT
jgi:hypothetical protein